MRSGVAGGRGDGDVDLQVWGLDAGGGRGQVGEGGLEGGEEGF